MRVFESLKVFVLKLDGTVISLRTPPVVLTEESTLDDIRQVLISGPLGTTDHDIFFPNWTKSIHVIKGTENLDQSSLTHEQVHSMKYDIGTTEELQIMLKEEHDSPGTHIVVLQQCRSKRYSRKLTDSSISNAHYDSCSTTNVTPTGKDFHSNEKSLNNNTRNTAFSLCMKASHHHHHNHHHHYQLNSQNGNPITFSTSPQPSPSSHHLLKSSPKRNHFRTEVPAAFGLPIPPPSSIHTPALIGTHSVPSLSCHENSFEHDHAVLYYPDPMMSYGLFQSTTIPSPHTQAQPIFPQVYAIPWNSGSVNYLPAGSIPATWFMA